MDLSSFYWKKTGRSSWRKVTAFILKLPWSTVSAPKTVRGRQSFRFAAGVEILLRKMV
jgi:hypothetical protein